MTSQFVLGLMTRGPGALKHSGKAVKGKNAGCRMKTDHSSLKHGGECCFSHCQYLCLFLLISEITIKDFQWLFWKCANDFYFSCKRKRTGISKNAVYTQNHDVRRRPSLELYDNPFASYV